ncbi:energy transducer TonB [Psychroflexus sp. YR1-1]|uniref:Energy transducer TonB n=1 Tax=Psychroflexus aurantiacus TaxID=2709310 RepID=A0A6B3R504_9FLAO|nr:energy transducer TonB [Psychroflexus aurantiacus]NEV94660.1 energy transducer TonB [Psychroflexus aurantiacus]
MNLFKTRHEKKSFFITTGIYILFVLLMFFFGLNYMDPPEQRGIAINFGTTEVGSGDVQPDALVKTSPQPKSTPPPPQEVEETTAEDIQDDVVTQESEEAPVIEDKKEVVKETKKQPEKPKEEVKEKVEEPEPEPTPEAEPEPVKEQKPEQSVTDAMESLMNGPENEGRAESGDGNDNLAGDKGDPEGDPNAKNYYGTGKGLDGDGNYRLGGRKAINKKKIVPDCDESGEVVVRIEVNRSGDVVKATPGAKGTTNASACLLDPARRAALATKFNSDPKAPTTQIGFITYVFKLSE